MATALPAQAPAVPLPFQDKFVAVRGEMDAKLIERENETRATLVAMVTREHCLLVGEPGTAKSMTLDALVKMIDGLLFDILLHEFIEPDELFGPVKMSGLKNDTYERTMVNTMIDCHIAFLDEFFKCNPSSLNMTLKILNERIYKYAGKKIPCNLRTAVAGSNEWPNSQDGGQSLGAVFDRFLIRREVMPIQSDAGLSRLFWSSTADLTPQIDQQWMITPADLDVVYQTVASIPWKKETVECYEEIVRTCRRKGIRPGDRRMHKAPKVCQGFAYIDGCDEVDDDHMEILCDVLWADPAEQPLAVEEIITEIARPTGIEVNKRMKEVREIVDQCDPRNLESGTEATSKLRSIAMDLKGLRGDKAKNARRDIRDQIVKIQQSAVSGISLDDDDI